MEMNLYLTGNQLENLSSQSDEQLIEITLGLLRWCNHSVRATSESIRASLEKMDATDRIAELYRSQRPQGNYQQK